MQRKPVFIGQGDDFDDGGLIGSHSRVSEAHKDPDSRAAFQIRQTQGAFAIGALVQIQLSGRLAQFAGGILAECFASAEP